MIQSMFFYILSAIAVLSAVMVVTQRNLFNSALYLAGTFGAIAGIFLLLSADFIAVVQILVYVGGILVLIVFAVLLSSLNLAKTHSQVNEQWIPSLLICGVIWITILVGLNRSPLQGEPGEYAPTTESIGHLLFGDLLLPFEVVSLVLLASLVGAVYFSKKRKDEVEPDNSVVNKS